MCVVPVGEPSVAASIATKREGFGTGWRRRSIGISPIGSKRAIPPVMVRRSKHDIDRCRRMMRKNAFKQVLAPADAGFSGMSHHRVVRRP